MIFRKGQKIQAVDELGWWEEVCVVEIASDGRYCVKFDGWSAEFNQVVTVSEVREIWILFQSSLSLEKQ